MIEQKNEHIENIRSDEVQEILGHVPHWMIRWGITLIFILILMLLFVSWMVKYPDVITGEVNITSKNPPIRLVNNVGGVLEDVKIKNGANVEKGTVLATIQNPISETEMEVVSAYINQIDSVIVTKEYVFPELDKQLDLGQIQSSWNELTKSVAVLSYKFNEDILKQRIQSIKKEIEYRKRLTTIAQRKMTMAEKDYVRSKQSLESGKKLFEQQVISKQKYLEEERLLDQTYGNFQSSKEAYVQNNIAINSLQKQLFELEYSNKQEEQDLLNQIQAQINTIKSFKETWKQTQVITAPEKGRISFPKTLVAHQLYPANQELFVLIPESNEYIGFVKLPVAGAGKVKKGQRVTIELQDFPEKEYGVLKGEVVAIGTIAKDGFYEVGILLKNGLQTSYDKTIPAKPELLGNAKIITEDLRIIERIFNQFRSVFENN